MIAPGVLIGAMVVHVSVAGLYLNSEFRVWKVNEYPPATYA
jgi:hypothetical protein